MVKIFNKPKAVANGQTQHSIEHLFTIKKNVPPLKAYAINDNKVQTKKLNNKVKTFTGTELYNMQIEPIKWVVPGIVGEGVTILAGKPKQGKSLLATNLCISIASGSKVLKNIEAEAGTVLYLALEDVKRRLQSRLFQMEVKADELKNLHISTTWPRMEQGGITELGKWLNSHPNTRLIVIDTLKMFRPTINGNSKYKNLYDIDYEPISKIKTEIADKYNISVLLIHHLRKSGADDIMDTFSGSIGLTAATDTNLVLNRITGQADAVLCVSGRDVEAKEYAMKFHSNNLSWEITGHISEVKSTNEKQVLYDALKNIKEKHTTPADLSNITGLHIQYIKKTLPKFVREGCCKKIGHGRYQYIPPEKNNFI
ncbi:MAG: AAA family ATPase [bacterium]|nr:AAA family ATPase [bacterium]